MKNITLNYTKYLFYIGLIILLIPIWQSKFFLTGDGPSHLYNSKVLGDLLFGQHTDFYLSHYDLNTQLEPNWLSHFILLFLLKIFPAFLAEKILLTLYILGFAFGLKKILKTLNPKAEWLVIFGFALVYQKIFFLGFYNCVFSYVLYFYFISFWLKNRKDLHVKTVVIATLFLTAIYFTHPMGLMLSIGTLGAIFMFELLVEKKDSIKETFSRAAKYIIICLPSVLLLLAYITRSTHKDIELTVGAKHLFHLLIEADFLYVLNKFERGIVMAISITFGMSFFYALFLRVRSRKIVFQDFYFFLFVGATISYLFSPAALAGGGFFIERMQFIVFLMLLLWLTSIDFHKKAKLILMSLVFIINTGLIIVRLPYQYELSQAAEEYASVSEFIEEESIVLPISFNHYGRSVENENIVDKFWIFLHAGDYLGAEKSIITLSNYEANTGYFPINYREDKNPFKIIGGVENQSPTPDLEKYERETGDEVDYLIFWCYHEDIEESETNRNWMNKINERYEKAFVSEFGRAILYKKRTN